MKTTLSAALLAAMVSGCSYQQGNSNNGQSQQLTFNGTHIADAVGGVVTVGVRHGDEGLYECTTSFFPTLGGGGCTFVGQVSPIIAVLSAECSNANCSAQVRGVKNDEVPVDVTVLAAGNATLHVKALFADGVTREDTVPMHFEAWQMIDVTCDGACPGPNAMMTGASLHWRVVLPLERGPQPSLFGSSPVSVEVEPDGILAASAEWPSPSLAAEFSDYRDDPLGDDVFGSREWSQRDTRELITNISLRAVGAGTATVTLKLDAGGLRYQRSLTVRVAGADEVVRAEVRQFVSDAPRGTGPGILADADVVGPPATNHLEPVSGGLMPVWVLTDGTLAVGGAAQLEASGPALYIPQRSGFATDDISHAVFYVAGDATAGSVHGQVGAARLDWNYERPQLPLTTCARAATTVCDGSVHDFTDPSWKGKPLPIHWEREGTEPSGCLRVRAGMELAFDEVLELSNGRPDDVVAQECGPAVAFPGVRLSSVDAATTTPGFYVFRGQTRADGSATRLVVEVVR